MSMVIGTNVSSITAQRHLENSRQSMETSMERLSSGKRINSAMDDSAGLVISHGLETKISSLNQGIRNGNDGISMLQTAEGALEETSAILNRMKELATQASSGSYSANDRAALDKEFQALAAAITAIATDTDFNGTNVLNSGASVNFQVGDGSTDVVGLQFQSMKATDLEIFDISDDIFELADMTNTTEFAIGAKQASTFTIGGAPTANARALEMDVNGKTYRQAHSASAAQTMILLGAQISADNEHIIATNNVGGTVLTLTSLTNGTASGVEGWTSTGLKIVETSNAITTTAAYVEGTSNSLSAKQAGTHTASALGDSEQFTITVNGIDFSQDFIESDATKTMAALASQINNSTANLAVTSSNTTLILTSTKFDTAFTTGALTTRNSFGSNSSLLTAAGAASAMSKIDDSIKSVDSYRSEIGAVANRLDHTVSNLMNRVENQSAAKSRIQDTDFARESANLAKAQVLQQAGTAMLAQANASGQSVLSLLK